MGNLKQYINFEKQKPKDVSYKILVMYGNGNHPREGEITINKDLDVTGNFGKNKIQGKLAYLDGKIRMALKLEPENTGENKGISDLLRSGAIRLYLTETDKFVFEGYEKLKTDMPFKKSVLEEKMYEKTEHTKDSLTLRLEKK